MPDFYAHKYELNWLKGQFPLDIEQIRGMAIDCRKLPEGYDVGKYEIFQGTLTRVFNSGDVVIKLSLDAAGGCAASNTCRLS